MILIKRYANRKLYNMDSKKYVTLEDIETMIKEGNNVQIVDNTSGEDITASTLSMIIAERAKKQQCYSPSLFVQIIRTGKSSVYDYFRKIVQTLSETAYFIEEEVEAKVKTLVDKGEISPEEGKALSEDLKKSESLRQEKTEKHLEKLLGGVLHKLNVPVQSDVQKLEESLAKLESRIGDLCNLEEKDSSP